MIGFCIRFVSLWILWLCLSTITTLASQEMESSDIQEKRVLIIQSYQRDYSHTQAIESGIVETFELSGIFVRLRFEFLDTKNFISDDYLALMADTMSEKYAGQHFDGIILSDDDALVFFIEYGDVLFPDVPYVVATGINSITAYPNLNPKITLIEERPHYEKTIDLALMQLKDSDIKVLNFIYDDTTTSREIRADIEILLKREYSTYQHRHFYEVSPDELEALVKRSDDQDLFFFILYSRDRFGVPYYYDEVPKRLTPYSRHPMYGFWEFYLGTGIFGGHMASSHRYGSLSAEIMIQLWHENVLPSIIPDVGAYQSYAFDYSVAERYAIQDFPKGATFIHKPTSYFQRYRNVILPFTFLILGLVVLIVLLLVYVRQIKEMARKNEEIGRLNEEMLETQKDMISRLGDVIEGRSQETANHVKRVAQISAVLARAYGLSEEQIQILVTISPMHDVGKIGIPEEILNKPHKLTKEEFEVLKYHTLIGYEILKNTEKLMLKYASIVALEHHEKWDGSGYPHGKKGEAIHIFARITAIADVFDALCSKRIYKEAWLKEDAIAYIKTQSGHQFDPDLVKLFKEHLDTILTIHQKISDQNASSQSSCVYELLKKTYLRHS